MSSELPPQSFRNVITQNELGGTEGDVLNTRRLVPICPCCGRAIEERKSFIRCSCGNIVHDNSECSVQFNEQVVCSFCLLRLIPMNDQRYFVLTWKIIKPTKDVRLHEVIGVEKRQLKKIGRELERYGLTLHDKPTPLGRMIWDGLTRVYCRRGYVADVLGEMGVEVHV